MTGAALTGMHDAKRGASEAKSEIVGDVVKGEITESFFASRAPILRAGELVPIFKKPFSSPIEAWDSGVADRAGDLIFSGKGWNSLGWDRPENCCDFDGTNEKKDQGKRE